jgi:hypothetical protein
MRSGNKSSRERSNVASQARKPCVFCQRTDQKISNEHIWPNWVLACFPQNTKLTVEMHRKGKDTKFWAPKDSTGVTANEICRPCNQGWMNGMEEAVRPFLFQMIEGGPALVLDEVKASLLSAWVYKIMLLFDLVGPREYRRFGKAQYERFYEHRRPPVAGVVAWLASYAGSMRSTATDRGLTFTDYGGQVVVGTFSIGHVAFQLLFYEPERLPQPGAWVPHIPPTWMGRLVRLWPIVGDGPVPGFRLKWPPAQTLDDGGLIELRNRWDRGLGEVRGLILSL